VGGGEQHGQSLLSLSPVFKLRESGGGWNVFRSGVKVWHADTNKKLDVWLLATIHGEGEEE